MKRHFRWLLSLTLLLSFASTSILSRADATMPDTAPAALQQPVSITNPMVFIGEDGNVYITDEAGNSTPQLVTGDASGGSTSTFPFFERRNAYGSLTWSSTANMLAFVQPSTKSLYVVENGKAPNKVSTLADGTFPPAFSPDGKEVGYVVQTGQAASTNPGDMVLQIQAVPAIGGSPRAVGSLVASPGQCGGDAFDPADMVFFSEIGLLGYSPLSFAWLNAGFLHTMGCNGRGLALSDGQKDLWQNPNLQSPALSPDGTQLVAILADPVKDPTGATHQLNLVDLATGKLTPLTTTPFVNRATFSRDGKTVLYSTLEPGTDTVKGNPASALGKQLFGDTWPRNSSKNGILVWSIPVTGGTPALLFKGSGRGVGFMTTGRTKPTLIFSLITSLADMIQNINSGEPPEVIQPLAPHPELTFIPADVFGTPFKTLRGGQPLVLNTDAFSIIPAQKTATPVPSPTVPTAATLTSAAPTLVTGPAATPTLLPTATPSIVLAVGGRCPGFLPSRLSVGGKGRVLPGSSNRIRATLPLGATVGNIPEGGIFDVLEGPICTSNAIAYWKVNYNGTIGYTPEGQGNIYWTEPYTPPAFAVTSAVVSVTPNSAAACPKTFNFTGTIATNAAGNVVYQWIRSDGGSGTPQTLVFTAAGSQTVTTNWSLGVAGSFWMQLKITSPNALLSNQATFTLSCGGTPVITPVIIITPIIVPTFGTTSSSASVSPAAAGACPKKFNFSGTITANAAGTVTYRWERSDGASAPTQTLVFSAAGAKAVTPTSWSLSASGTFWQRLHILTPNNLYSNQASFTQTCP